MDNETNKTQMKMSVKYLVSFSDSVSEWKNSFLEVQDEMNKLEFGGIVSGVTVAQFKGGILSSKFTYDYNGQEWEKR